MANRLCGYAHVNFQPFTVNTAVMLFSIQYIYYYSAVKDCTISKEKPDYFASTMYTGQLYNYCTQTMIPGCVRVRVLYHKTEPATYVAAATSLRYMSGFYIFTDLYLGQKSNKYRCIWSSQEWLVFLMLIFWLILGKCIRYSSYLWLPRVPIVRDNWPIVYDSI